MRALSADIAAPRRAARSWPSRSTTTRSSTAITTSATSSTWGRARSFLLGLCFCEHCLAGARAAGVDGAAAAALGAGRDPARLRRGRGRIGGARARPRRGRWPAGSSARYLDARADAVPRAWSPTPPRPRLSEGAAFAFLDASGADQGLRGRTAGRRPCRGDRLAARRRPGRRSAKACAASRGDRLRGRPGPRPARPRGLPGAASARRIALGRHAAHAARLRLARRTSPRSCVSRASSGSSASTCTTTASRRSRARPDPQRTLCSLTGPAGRNNGRGPGVQDQGHP